MLCNMLFPEVGAHTDKTYYGNQKAADGGSIFTYTIWSKVKLNSADI